MKIGGVTRNEDPAREPPTLEEIRETGDQLLQRIRFANFGGALISDSTYEYTVTPTDRENVESDEIVLKDGRRLRRGLL